MKHTHRYLSPVLFALACLALPAAEEKPAEAKPAPVKEESFTVECADLQPTIDAECTLEPATKKILRVLPEEFAGPFGVLEALPTGRKVETGVTVVRLDTSGIERNLRASREALEGARKKYEAMHEDFATLQTSNRLKLERMTLDLSNAQRDQKIFDKFGE